MTITNLKLTELESLGQAAECLRTLAHPHRLRMVQMLLQGDFAVGDLAEACGLPSAMASEHLRLMQRCARGANSWLSTPSFPLENTATIRITN